MKFFKSKKGIPIPSNKEETKNLMTIEFKSPEYVYIPLSLKGNDFEILVKPGDKVKVGQKIAERKAEKGLPVVKHASVSGEVIGTERKPHPTGVPFVCIKIKNDFHDTFIETNKIENIDEVDNEKLLDIIHEAGIVGLGGAEFPTALKYKDVKNIDTVILNGAECEPYITADYRIMEELTDEVIDGLRILMKVSNAKQGFIVIKKSFVEIYRKLVNACKGYNNITVLQVPDIYPAGWERQVVYRTTKRAYDNYPLECGVIVNNVSTAVSVANAVRKGLPLIERYVTVTGEGIVKPNNYRVRIGTLAKDLLELSGGIAPEYEEVRLIAGGPMMGISQKSDEFVITEAVPGILVLDSIENYQVPHNQPVGDVLLDILHFKEHDSRKFVRDEQPCVRCGTCVFHCPAGLQPTLLRFYSLAKNENTLAKLDITKCIDCGTCSYVCPSHISINEAIKKGKTYYNVKMRNKR